MGITFCGFHLYNIYPETVYASAGDKDVLRTVNAPWLAVLPPDGEDSADRLLRLGKKLTAERREALALHFYWFDDMRFNLCVIRNGRVAKVISDSDPWTFLGKTLAEAYGDDQPAKACRLSKQCLDLDEKLELLEETVGTALYDLPWEAPRRVTRGHEARDRLRRRQSTLRRKENRYRLEPVAFEDWPEYPRACLTLARRMRKACHSGYYDVMTDPYLRRFAVPHRPWVVAYTGHVGGSAKECAVYDSRADAFIYRAVVRNTERPLWVTRDHEAVFSAFGNEGPGIRRIVCVGADGAERWRFTPMLAKTDCLSCVDVSREGVITASTSTAENGRLLVWRIDGETGNVRCGNDIGARLLRYVESVGAFVAVDEAGRDLVLFDETLNEAARLHYGEWPIGTYAPVIGGSVLWSFTSQNGSFHGLDLKDGARREFRPEIPSLVLKSVLPNGDMAAEAESGASLFILDGGGKLAARLKAEAFHTDCLADGTPCIVEVTDMSKNGIITQDAIDSVGVRVQAIVNR